MSQNRFLYPLIAFVVIVTGYCLWKFLPPAAQKTEIHKIYRTTTPPQTTPMPATSKMELRDSHPDRSEEEKKLSYEDITSPNAKVKRWLRTMAKAKASLSPEELAERQRYFEVLESPGYLELVRNGANMDERWNFMADAGLEVTRNITQVAFRGGFPTGEPADYEPEMRAKLLSLITEEGVLSLEVLDEFSADPLTRTWIMGHFKGDYQLDGELSKWLNYVSVQALTQNPTQEVSGTTAPQKTTESFPDANTVSDPPERLPEAEHSQLEEFLRQFQQEGRSEIKDEHVQTPDLQVPELPTNESLEKNLRDAFSPTRFNRAMETLNRYGPDEGLRRLKESDPEVAKRIERLLPTDQENNR